VTGGAKPTHGPSGDGATSIGTTPGESLFTGPFRWLLLLSLLGFGGETIVRAVIPLMVLDRGGDAVVIGFLASIYALPSVVFRPIVGELVDSWHHRTLLRGGALFSATVPIFLLLPGIGTMLVVRFLHGSGFAIFSVANHSLLAKLAPPHRRGEASGIFMTMSAMATVIGPGLGVALYTATGEVVPLVVAAAVGLGAGAVTFRITVPESRAPGGAAAAQGPRPSLIERFVERSALPGTLMLITSNSAYTLMTIFAPVYALAVGAPITALVIYYPIFGLARVVTLPFAGRISDALGRSRTITLGSIVAGAGLMVVMVPGMETLTIAAVAYALAMSILNPAISALTIERAPANRIGAAMATYTIGYQVANAASGLLWGALIALFGFPSPFVVAVGLMLITIVLSRRLAKSPGLRGAGA
jgi:MFS family permease